MCREKAGGQDEMRMLRAMYAEGEERLDRKLVDPACRGISGDGNRTESVQGPLKDQHADGGHRKLERHRQGDPQMLPVESPVEFPVAQTQMQNRKFPDHEDQTQESGKSLRNHGGPRGARHAAFQIQNEIEIQHHVDQGGDDQEIERSPTVSESADDAGEHSVEDKGPCSVKNHDQIIARILEDLLRCIHDPEDGPHPEHTEERDKNRNHRTDDRGCGNGLPHPLVIVRSEPLSGDDGESAGKSEEETENQKHD